MNTPESTKNSPELKLANCQAGWHQQRPFMADEVGRVIVSGLPNPVIVKSPSERPCPAGARAARVLFPACRGPAIRTTLVSARRR